MGKENFFVLLISSIFLLSGCQQEKINIPDTGRKIVINGLITTDTLLNVFISRSDYLLDLSGNGYEYLRDLDSLEVCLYQNNDKIDSLYHYKYYDYDYWKMFNYGNYRSHNVHPLASREYKIVAKGSGFPTASAVTTIPDLVRIERVDTSRIILAPGEYYDSNIGLQIKIEFSDPLNETNCYLFRMYMNIYWEYYGSYIPYYSDVIFFTCQDPIIEEKLTSVNGLEAIAFSDKVINGQRHSLNIIVKGESIGKPYTDYPESSYSNPRKTLYFKLYSITEEYFSYIQTLHLYSKNYSNPLLEPVLMNSNVTGGYGMFSGASVSSDSIVFKFE